MDFRDIKEFLKDSLKYIIMILIILIIVIYIVSFQQVIGPSMSPTLKDGDVLIVNKIIYKFREIKRNEVVVFKYDEKLLIKRIVGLPNEHIAYNNNVMYVNGDPVKEEFIDTTTDDFDIKELGYDVIPKGYYLVLGDNRNNSMDGRNFGLIKKEDIIGKAWIRLWPLNKLKIVKWLTFELKSYRIIIGKVIER